MRTPNDQITTYRIRHVTRYDYGAAVSIAHNEARLVPRPTPNQETHGTQIQVEPAPSYMTREPDYFGNVVSRFALEEEHNHFAISAHSRLTVHAPKVPEALSTQPWERVRDQLQTPGPPEDVEAYEFTFTSPLVDTFPELHAFACKSFTPGRPALDAAADLTSRIHQDFKYDPEATTVATPLGEVVESRRGVCQDFAHVQLSCLRSLGLAARYVSGYLRTYPAPGKPRLEGADASHAWVSIFLPGHGWVDLDPTNDMRAGTDHATVAWGRDFGDVSPLKGVVRGGSRHDVAVSVDVMPESEGTKPPPPSSPPPASGQTQSQSQGPPPVRS